MGPNPMTDDLIKRGKFGHKHRYTGRISCDNGGRGSSDLSILKDHQGLWIAIRS